MTSSSAAPIGIGCMRLPALGDGVRVLSAAVAAGARVLDTADVYHEASGSIGDNEAIVAEVVRAFAGDPGELTVVTKGGMTRRGARWIPDGRARHLRAACEASLARLGRIDLYLLHAPDPKTSLATSVRALAELRDAGAVARIGVCNVNRAQLDEALALTDLDAIQIALSPIDIRAVRGGVVARARERGMQVLVHSPLGGPRGIVRLRKHKALRAIAETRDVTVEDLAIAWCRDLDPGLVPIPGVSSEATAVAAVRAQRAPTIDASTRLELDRELVAGPLLRTPAGARRPASPDGDVVIVMGIPGAGKSTLAAGLVKAGYTRLNRDKRGGNLAALIGPLTKALASGHRNVVLDNTYGSRAARNEVIEAAWAGGASARCLHLETTLEDAQINVVTRMIRSHGTLPDPETIKKLARKSSGVFAPSVLFNYRRSLEPPHLDEGFESVEPVAFTREPSAARTGRALIVEIDGVLRETRSGDARPAAVDDIRILPGRAAILKGYHRDGYRLLGVSWQPDIGAGSLGEETASACFARTTALLGVDIEIEHCPHVAGPPACWCRKPLPGLGVGFIERHKLDPAQVIMVGRNSTDALFAGRLGFDYRDAETFFAPTATATGPGS